VKNDKRQELIRIAACSGICRTVRWCKPKRCCGLRTGERTRKSRSRSLVRWMRSAPAPLTHYPGYRVVDQRRVKRPTRSPTKCSREVNLPDGYRLLARCGTYCCSWPGTTRRRFPTPDSQNASGPTGSSSRQRDGARRRCGRGRSWLIHRPRRLIRTRFDASHAQSELFRGQQ